MRLLVRLPLGAALALAFVFVQVPLHEYGHCLSYWARGGGMCDVRYAAPGRWLPDGDDRSVMAGAVGQAFVGPAPWWEHPLFYALHVTATAAFGFWLGGWMTGAQPRPARQDSAPAEDPSILAAWPRLGA
jgi:hypothetical protein